MHFIPSDNIYLLIQMIDPFIFTIKFIVLELNLVSYWMFSLYSICIILLLQLFLFWDLKVIYSLRQQEYMETRLRVILEIISSIKFLENFKNIISLEKLFIPLYKF